MRSYFLLLLALPLFFSCKQEEGFDMEFQIHTESSGPKPRPGDYVRFNLIMKTEDGSKILRNTFNEGKPVVKRIPPAEQSNEVFQNIAQLSVGDSATFYIPSDSLLKGAPQGPNDLQPGQRVFFIVKLLEIPTEQQLREEITTEMNEQMMKDSTLINTWLNKFEMQAEKTDAGVYIIREREGTGPTAQNGQQVSVKYTGKFLDGEIFDSSGEETIDLVLGTHQVIPGWEDALTHLREGAKATLLIPSHMGYGPVGGGPIPPNAVLVFEIELVDIQGQG